jgi:hypothetical protein
LASMIQVSFAFMRVNSLRGALQIIPLFLRGFGFAMAEVLFSLHRV